jgi:hypothetical protein
MVLYEGVGTTPRTLDPGSGWNARLAELELTGFGLCILGMAAPDGSGSN